MEIAVWSGIILFTGASFFFALAESALFSLGKWRAQRLAEEQGEPGVRVLQLLSQPQDLLATIVLGNTFANAGLIGAGLWLVLQGRWPVDGTLALLFVLILVGCEVVPKTLAVRSPERWSLRLAGLIRLCVEAAVLFRVVAQWINGRLVRMLVPGTIKPQQPLTDEEYEELIELAYQQGALAEAEKEIILQIIQLDQRTVREVMRPRAQMISVSDELELEEMVGVARKHRVQRLPIYDGNPDVIAGVLNLRRLFLDPKMGWDEAVEFPSFVPETMNLLQLLKSFQRQKRGLAIVLDEFGGTAGVVTMEDILEEVVGELRQEGEPVSTEMERLGEGRWRVQGAMRMDDFREYYPALEEVPEVETMGGLLIYQLGVVPRVGETATVGGVRLKATAVDERRVKELVVETVRGKKG